MHHKINTEHLQFTQLIIYTMLYKVFLSDVILDICHHNDNLDNIDKKLELSCAKLDTHYRVLIKN